MGTAGLKPRLLLEGHSSTCSSTGGAGTGRELALKLQL